jgi:uncharacterized protein
LHSSAPAFFHRRYLAIDVLRGLALFGVLSANLMQAFRVSLFEQMLAAPTPVGWHNQAALALVNLLFSYKAIAVFSLLFGFGLAMQYDSLRQHGKPMRWLIRRLLVLFLFGLLHLLFIWNGDILTHYAIVGLLALPFLGLPPRFLLLAAALPLGLFVFPEYQPWRIDWASEAQLRAAVAAASEILPSGSYSEIVRQGWRELPLIFPLDQFVFPRTLGLFLFGAWCQRVGLVEKMQRHRRACVVFAAGASGVFLVEQGMQHIGYFFCSDRWADFLINFAPMLLACAYAALVIAVCQPERGDDFAAHPHQTPHLFARAFAAVGKLAFTNYLMQSLIFTWVFYGYGLGLFNQVGEAQALALGLAVYLLQIIFSMCWLRRYQFGPVEWVWRSLMFGRWQRIRRGSAPNH